MCGKRIRNHRNRRGITLALSFNLKSVKQTSLRKEMNRRTILNFDLKHRDMICPEQMESNQQFKMSLTFQERNI